MRRSTHHLTMRTPNGSTATPPPSGTAEGAPLDFGTFTTGLVKNVGDYVDVQKRYLQLTVTERISVMLAGSVNAMVLAVCMGTLLLFMNVALAFYLGDEMGSRALGFLLVGGIYLVLFLAFTLWWRSTGRERFILARMKEMNPDDEHEEREQPR